mmetsp:Transcript_72658/g.201475  ORF Transcript_72658/g.201475 Transcript_72658/m.201475 type:complete len:344 (-) Transcript_72658:3-1034(-)
MYLEGVVLQRREPLLDRRTDGGFLGEAESRARAPRDKGEGEAEHHIDCNADRHQQLRHHHHQQDLCQHDQAAGVEGLAAHDAPTPDPEVARRSAHLPSGASAPLEALPLDLLVLLQAQDVGNGLREADGVQGTATTAADEAQAHGEEGPYAAQGRAREDKHAEGRLAPGGHHHEHGGHKHEDQRADPPRQPTTQHIGVSAARPRKSLAAALHADLHGRGACRPRISMLLHVFEVGLQQPLALRGVLQRQRREPALLAPLAPTPICVHDAGPQAGQEAHHHKVRRHVAHEAVRQSQTLKHLQVLVSLREARLSRRHARLAVHSLLHLALGHDGAADARRCLSSS